MVAYTELTPRGGQVTTGAAVAERVIVVQVGFPSDTVTELLDRQSECQLLVASAGGLVIDSILVKRSAADAAFFVGKGKVTELHDKVAASGCQLVVFNHSLSPVQERNLEKALSCRVIGRSSLILDIFALRAKSAEGKLQVELAQLEYQASRLVRGWTHLERQQGGIGVRGPGETQLETDRRLLGKRVRFLKEKLQRLSRQRHVQRKARAHSCLNVSLVGYTNAGKSTLFNALTNETVYAANQLFATLDTTSRKLWLANNLSANSQPYPASSPVTYPESVAAQETQPTTGGDHVDVVDIVEIDENVDVVDNVEQALSTEYDVHVDDVEVDVDSGSGLDEQADIEYKYSARAGREVIISDTVGFIRDLPHELIAAFHATLEATAEADLLLHVVDAASPNRDEQMAEVNRVLQEIHAEQIPQICVLNKIDLLQHEGMAGIEYNQLGEADKVRVSARSGEGLDHLKQALQQFALKHW